MGKEPSYKQIWRLALPAMVAGIIEPVLSLTDMAVVGNIPSSSLGIVDENLSAVAAVGIAGSLISTLIWIFAQLKSASSAIVSQRYGAQEMEKVETLIPQILFFGFCCGILALSLTYFSAHWIFENALSTSGAILSDATIYYQIRVIGIPLTIVTYTIFGVFRGIQNTWWAMLIALFGGIINVLLDFMLVLGWGGFFEPIGVAGAAWASVIAQFLMLLLSLFILAKSGIKWSFSKRLNPLLKPLISIAWNLVIRTFVLNVALMLTHKFANIYGTTQAATHAVILNLWLFSAFFLDGFASSANAMAGKFLGAKDYSKMKRNLSINLFLSLVVAGCSILVLSLFDSPIMGILIDNEEVKNYYPLILPLFLICLPINSIAFTLDGIFKGMGEAKFLRNVLLISTLGGFLPVLLLGHYFSPGLPIIWYAIIAWMLIRAALPYGCFVKIMRRNQ